MSIDPTTMSGLNNSSNDLQMSSLMQQSQQAQSLQMTLQSQQIDQQNKFSVMSALQERTNKAADIVKNVRLS